MFLVFLLSLVAPPSRIAQSKQLLTVVDEKKNKEQDEDDV
jgi:hypothetical protein